MVSICILFRNLKIKIRIKIKKKTDFPQFEGPVMIHRNGSDG